MPLANAKVCASNPNILTAPAGAGGSGGRVIGGAESVGGLMASTGGTSPAQKPQRLSVCIFGVGLNQG